MAHLHGLTTQSRINRLSLHAGRLGSGFRGDATPRRTPGFPRPHPAVQKHWCGSVGKRGGDERADRAILFGVCTQSCQFRSPGQKSFYLLNQDLCRTKCQAGFKAGRCAEPQAAITLRWVPAPTCPSPGPVTEDTGPLSPHALRFL